MTIDQALTLREALEAIRDFVPKPEDCDPRIPDDPYIKIAQFARRTARQALASHSPDDVEKVKAALVLAANRLDLLVVEAIAAGNPHSIEYGQWVEEARAALTARKAT